MMDFAAGSPDRRDPTKKGRIESGLCNRFEFRRRVLARCGQFRIVYWLLMVVVLAAGTAGAGRPSTNRFWTSSTKAPFMP